MIAPFAALAVETDFRRTGWRVATTSRPRPACDFRGLIADEVLRGVRTAARRNRPAPALVAAQQLGSRIDAVRAARRPAGTIADLLLFMRFNPESSAPPP
jgi:hypothetical protein